jgi:hypothetical protein
MDAAPTMLSMIALRKSNSNFSLLAISVVMAFRTSVATCFLICAVANSCLTYIQKLVNHISQVNPIHQHLPIVERFGHA